MRIATSIRIVRHPAVIRRAGILLPFLLAVLAWPAAGRAQAALSPLSTAKLRVPSADPVPGGHVELGLHFQMGWSSRVYGETGKISRVDSLATDGLLGFRVSWGIVDERSFGMELGSILPLVFRWGEDYAAGTTWSAAGLGDVPLGTKLRVLAIRDWSFSLAITGAVPTGDRNQVSTGYGRMGGGFLLSGRLVEGLTMDFTLLVDGPVGLRDRDRADVAVLGMETNVAFSWIERRGFWRVFTPCLELGHRIDVATRGDVDQRIRHRLALNVGFVIQLTKRVVMTQAAQVDLAGTNQPMGAGWIMNTTFLL